MLLLHSASVFHCLVLKEELPLIFGPSLSHASILHPRYYLQ